MRRKMAEILQDDSALNEYLEELNEKVEIDNNLEAKIDLILENLLSKTKFDNFNNVKYLRSTYIDSVANLLKLKTEIPLKRAQTQKLLVDILSKKKDLELKEKSLKNNEEGTKTITDSLRSVFEYLDKNDIHPQVDDIDVIDSKSIVDDETTNNNSESVENGEEN